MYEPIPSLNYRYEVNERGYVRNARTKKRLKRYKYNKGGSAYYVKLRKKADGSVYDISVNQLLFEVHGKIPAESPFRRAQAVTLINGLERRYFPTIQKAAKFLSGRVNRCVSQIRHILAARKTELYGWSVIYHEKEKRIFRSTTLINGDKDLRR